MAASRAGGSVPQNLCFASLHNYMIKNPPLYCHCHYDESIPKLAFFFTISYPSYCDTAIDQNISVY